MSSINFPKMVMCEWHILTKKGESLEKIVDELIPRQTMRKHFRKYQRELDRIGENNIRNSFFACTDADGQILLFYDDFDHFGRSDEQLAFPSLTQL